MRFAPGQVRPDEHHRGARRGGEDDQAGDIGADLIGGQIGPEQIADEERAERRHRERLDRPIDEQGHADAAPVLTDFAERGKVDLDQHGNDHEPDQGRHRQVDLGDFRRADRMKYAWREMAEDNARDDAQGDPHGEIAFEQGH